MVKGNYPPVVLVKAWVLVATSDRPQLQQCDHRAQMGIKQFFGSVTLAELYIEQVEMNTEVVLI
ncbi:MAG: hypothetical protein MJK12_13145 [Colwellia sp.]|nr:hypothetical protein [Colwellia sp.]